MLQDSCISLLLRFQSSFGGGWLGGRLAVPLHGALAFLSWGGWRNKSTYTPQRRWWVGFSSGMLQLFPRMDSSLSMACLIASDKDQILELDSKAEFFFSFFFPLQVKNQVAWGSGGEANDLGLSKIAFWSFRRILCWCFHFYLLLL